MHLHLRLKHCVGINQSALTADRRGGGGGVREVLEGGGGVWDPKVCVPKMARQDFTCKFRFFPPQSLRSGGRGVQGGGGGNPPPPMVYGHCNTSLGGGGGHSVGAGDQVSAREARHSGSKSPTKSRSSRGQSRSLFRLPDVQHGDKGLLPLCHDPILPPNNKRDGPHEGRVCASRAPLLHRRR